MKIEHPLTGWALEMKKTLWDQRETYRERLTMLWDWDDRVIVAWPRSLLTLGTRNGRPVVCPGTDPYLYDRPYAEILCRTVHNGHLQYPCIYTQEAYYRQKLVQVEQLLVPFMSTQTDPQP